MLKTTNIKRLAIILIAAITVCGCSAKPPSVLSDSSENATATTANGGNNQTEGESFNEKSLTSGDTNHTDSTSVSGNKGGSPGVTTGGVSGGTSSGNSGGTGPTVTPPAVISENVVYYVNAANVINNAGGIKSGDGYDQLKFIVAIQGLLNRTKPQMFVELTAKPGAFYDESEYDVDKFWFNYLKSKNYMGNNKSDYTEIKINSIEDVLNNEQLINFIKSQGLVLWDKNVNATSNVASTICGIDGYLPVMGGSNLAKRLGDKGVSVKLDLQNKFTAKGTIWGTSLATSGSKKSDAYLWALEKYGNKVAADKVGYVVDSYAMNPKSTAAKNLFDWGQMYSHNQVVNHDYFILNGCFVFDLSPFADSIPHDDNDYGRTAKDTDFNTFKKILLKLYQRNGGKVGMLSGYTPWSIKYTAHTGERTEVGGLDAETTFIALANAYNFVVDADAPSMGSIASCSFYSHIKLNSTYSNPAPAKINYDSNKKYVYIYGGDYDGAAWTNRFVPKFFADSTNRGSQTLSWTFNPNLSQRLPHVFQYLQENKTSKDHFVSGDSGAGYSFPDIFRGDNEVRKAISGLPDGMNAFTEWNQKYYKQFGLDVTGFLLSHDVILNGKRYQNKVTSQVMEAFYKFSPAGIVASQLPNINSNAIGSDNRWAVYKRGSYNLMVNTMRNDIYNGNVTKYGNDILNQLRNSSDKFLSIRSIVTKPSELDLIIAHVKRSYPNVEFVDAYNFFQLSKQAYGIG